MALLRRFEATVQSAERTARQVRSLSGFDVLEAERSEAGRAVREIINQVRTSGDRALCELTRRFDGVAMEPHQIRVPPEQISRAAERLDERLRQAIRTAIENVRRFQEHLLFRALGTFDKPGVRMEMRHWPLQRVGVYVPAGAAPLPSTVIHCAVPALVAGVEEVVIASPPRGDGSVDEVVLATAAELGIDEVYALGGAQAVAALALGTESIRPVDKVVGPGNIYAQLAKKMLYGVVDIDCYAGPSEVVVVADRTANPRFVAADLLAQAEHSPGQAVVVSDDESLLNSLEDELASQLAQLCTARAARECLRKYGAAVRAADMAAAVEFVNAYAPEHLQVEVAEPRAFAAQIRSAGAVFLGHWTPESLGDYIAGPSHVLPTGGTARFGSGLAATDFIRRAAWIEYDCHALAEAADATVALAEAEGLQAHANAVKVRIEALRARGGQFT